MNVRPQTLDLGIYLSVFKLFNSFRLSGHSIKNLISLIYFKTILSKVSSCHTMQQFDSVRRYKPERYLPERYRKHTFLRL